MERIANLSIAQKLACLAVVFLTGFLGFTALAHRTLERVQVNGPIYHDIVCSKDVVADVLPPPEYIIETYLVTLRMTHEQDRAALQRLIDDGRRLRREYDGRHAFWETQPLQADLRQALLTTSYRPAMAFFDLWEREFVPAIRAGDRARATALAHRPACSRPTRSTDAASTRWCGSRPPTPAATRRTPPPRCARALGSCSGWPPRSCSSRSCSRA